jgi:hypothetical protein
MMADKQVLQIAAVWVATTALMAVSIYMSDAYPDGKMSAYVMTPMVGWLVAFMWAVFWPHRPE